MKAARASLLSTSLQALASSKHLITCSVVCSTTLERGAIGLFALYLEKSHLLASFLGIHFCACLNVLVTLLIDDEMDSPNQYPPTTPRKDRGRNVDAKIQAIAVEFGITQLLLTREQNQLLSPREWTKTLEQSAVQCITFLFWKNEAGLEYVLRKVREHLRENVVYGSTLSHMVDLLADHVKLVKEETKEGISFQLEEPISPAKTGLFVDEVQFEPRGRATTSPSPQHPSAKPPSSLRQSTIVWKSSKPNTGDTKASSEFAVPAKPTLRKKRPSDESLPEAIKHSLVTMRARHERVSTPALVTQLCPRRGLHLRPDRASHPQWLRLLTLTTLTNNAARVTVILTLIKPRS